MSSEEMAREGRRSPRIVARTPLDVQPIQESCTTAVINLHGALILSPVPWPSILCAANWGGLGSLEPHKRARRRWLSLTTEVAALYVAVRLVSDNQNRRGPI